MLNLTKYLDKINELVYKNRVHYLMFSVKLEKWANWRLNGDKLPKSQTRGRLELISPSKQLAVNRPRGVTGCSRNFALSLDEHSRMSWTP